MLRISRKFFISTQKLEKMRLLTIFSKCGHGTKGAGVEASPASPLPPPLPRWPLWLLQPGLGGALVFVLLSSVETGLQLVSGCHPAAEFLSRPPWWQPWVGSRQGDCVLGVAIPPRHSLLILEPARGLRTL